MVTLYNVFNLVFLLNGSTTYLAHPKSRGKLSALVGFCSGIGALIGAFGLYRMSGEVDKVNFHVITTPLHLSHAISGVLSLIMSFIAFTFLQARPLVFAHQKSFARLAKEGFYSLNNAEITLSYFGSFLARADSMAASLFIPMHVLL